MTFNYFFRFRGFILQELFRRLDPQKRTIGQYLRKEVSEPLGADVYLGATDEEVARRAPLSVWSKEKVFANLLIPEILGRKIEMNALG